MKIISSIIVVAACLFAQICFATIKSAQDSQDNDKCMVGDCTNGNGVMEYAVGNKFEGDFKDGLPHGKGTFTFPKKGVSYQGEFKNGEYSGQSDADSYRHVQEEQEKEAQYQNENFRIHFLQVTLNRSGMSYSIPLRDRL